MRVFNRIFARKKFAEVRKTDLQYLRDELHKSKRIIDTILEAIDRLAESAGKIKWS